MGAGCPARGIVVELADAIRAPRIGDMGGKAPGADKHDIESNIETFRLTVGCQKCLGSTCQAAALSGADRRQACFQVGPCFDFNEDDQTAAPGNDIDFTGRRAQAPGKDAEPVQPQVPGA